MRGFKSNQQTQGLQKFSELAGHSKLFVKQVHEFAEWFGFETRNKYQITDEHDRPIAYAA